MQGPGYQEEGSKKSSVELSSPEITAHLEKKIYAYQQQDIKAGRLVYNDDYKCFNAVLINLEQFRDLLQDGLECHYCSRETNIIPAKVRDPAMMTLDRICNTKCHTFINVVISCYSCNVLRSNDLSSTAFKGIFKRC